MRASRKPHIWHSRPRLFSVLGTVVQACSRSIENVHYLGKLGNASLRRRKMRLAVALSRHFCTSVALNAMLVNRTPT
jgi:hypothetical protein